MIISLVFFISTHAHGTSVSKSVGNILRACSSAERRPSCQWQQQSRQAIAKKPKTVHDAEQLSDDASCPMCTCNYRQMTHGYINDESRDILDYIPPKKDLCLVNGLLSCVKQCSQKQDCCRMQKFRFSFFLGYCYAVSFKWLL